MKKSMTFGTFPSHEEFEQAFDAKCLGFLSPDRGMKVSRLASAVATQYMLRRQALMAEGMPAEEEGAPAPETAGQNKDVQEMAPSTTAMPKSPVGQKMLLEALDLLQEAFDNLDDDAFQKQLEVVKKLSVPGQEAAKK